MKCLHPVYEYCSHCRYKQWKLNHPDEYRANSRRRGLKRRHGITVEEYDKLLRLQGGMCAICHGIDRYKRRLAVDHDHKTQKIRGLLCTDCNRLLGRAHDSIEFLSSAASYLSQPREA